MLVLAFVLFNSLFLGVHSQLGDPCSIGVEACGDQSLSCVQGGGELCLCLKDYYLCLNNTSACSEGLRQTFIANCIELNSETCPESCLSVNGSTTNNTNTNTNNTNVTAKYYVSFNPLPSQPFTVGQQIPITWKSNIECNQAFFTLDFVSCLEYDCDTLFTLQENVPPSGSYLWTIPWYVGGALANSTSGYRFRLTLNEPTCFRKSTTNNPYGCVAVSATQTYPPFGIKNAPTTLENAFSGMCFHSHNTSATTDDSHPTTSSDHTVTTHDTKTSSQSTDTKTTHDTKTSSQSTDTKTTDNTKTSSESQSTSKPDTTSSKTTHNNPTDDTHNTHNSKTSHQDTDTNNTQDPIDTHFTQESGVSSEEDVSCARTVFWEFNVILCFCMYLLK